MYIYYYILVYVCIYVCMYTLIKGSNQNVETTQLHGCQPRTRNRGGQSHSLFSRNKDLIFRLF